MKKENKKHNLYMEFAETLLRKIKKQTMQKKRRERLSGSEPPPNSAITFTIMRKAQKLRDVMKR